MINLKIIKRLNRVVLLLLTSFGLFACGSSGNLSPEDQVRATIKNMEAAIEDRSGSALFEFVSQQYQDHKGNDTDKLRKIAQIYFLQNKSIEMISHIKSVEFIDAQTAAVEASVTMGASSGGGLSGLRLDNQDISAVFQQEADEWKLVSLSWEYMPSY